jgi:hypothetical protein
LPGAITPVEGLYCGVGTERLLPGKKPILLLQLGLSLVLVVARLWARDVIVAVEDRDLELPLEGAVIRSWDGVDYVCGEDGEAVIPVPDDRQVSVQASYPGYETGRLAIPLRGERFVIGLLLGSSVESRELVVEAARPGSSETRSGRSVAISGETMERSSRIGLIEDVMTSIKLLPGVGYTGMFNALPSIRGGDPGDLMAALDGFYIENPYHWGGGFSIFDPHMVASAQLSHGIFSTRYGHTISGLLEVSSRKAATDHAEMELGVSSSAVNLNAALPLGAKGGLMLMGKSTYWDPYVWALKQLSKVWDNETLQMINAVTTAPYIRSGAASFHYRVSPDLEVTASAFIGTDGMGADFLNESPNRFGRAADPLVRYRSRMAFDWNNLQTFLIGGLAFNPIPSMVLRASAGAGYESVKIDGGIHYDYLRVDEINAFGVRATKYELGGEHLDTSVKGNQWVANVQGRFDADWSLGNGFLAAAGAHELFSERVVELEGKFFYERKVGGPYPDPNDRPDWWPFPLPPLVPAGSSAYIHYPVGGVMPETRNRRFNTSGYALAEYTSPGGRFGAELGLRADHLYFQGDSFSIQTAPVANPRLNVDFNLYRGPGFIESVGLTAGTGLFSSMNDAINAINVDNGMGDFDIRPNRSWTSILGVKTDIAGGFSFNLEAYFKYVYDRAYQYVIMDPGKDMSSAVFRFNGDGIVWGFDFMLQKFDSRYWDGWLSYTFTYARYHEPERPARNQSESGNTVIEDSGWYYPYFHRFHNVNLVLNIKPWRNFNIYTRLGLASGRPKAAVGEITQYDVYVLDGDGKPVIESGRPLKITKFKRESAYSDNSRTTWSVPLDMKFSYTVFNPRNKVQTEMYAAGENLASLFYTAQSNTSFNQYTGYEDTGSDSASYEMPVPMVSIGLKWSF